jgi:hypothetical protein
MSNSNNLGKNDNSQQTNLRAGTIIERGNTKYQILKDERCNLGHIATEIGDRELTDDQVPDIGDNCVLPECDGMVEEVNGRRWCSEGCLEWLRETPAQGDDCDKYGDKCDGQLDVTVHDDGSVDHKCNSCGRGGWSRSIIWREAWLPFNDKPGKDGNTSEERRNE